jgi:hypothetical protein
MSGQRLLLEGRELASESAVGLPVVGRPTALASLVGPSDSLSYLLELHLKPVDTKPEVFLAGPKIQHGPAEHGLGLHVQELFAQGGLLLPCPEQDPLLQAV